jgi:hypothetical protein
MTKNMESLLWRGETLDREYPVHAAVRHSLMSRRRDEQYVVVIARRESQV